MTQQIQTENDRPFHLMVQLCISLVSLAVVYKTVSLWESQAQQLTALFMHDWFEHRDLLTPGLQMAENCASGRESWKWKSKSRSIQPIAAFFGESNVSMFFHEHIWDISSAIATREQSGDNSLLFHLFSMPFIYTVDISLIETSLHEFCKTTTNFQLLLKGKCSMTWLWLFQSGFCPDYPDSVMHCRIKRHFNLHFQSLDCTLLFTSTHEISPFRRKIVMFYTNILLQLYLL